MRYFMEFFPFRPTYVGDLTSCSFKCSKIAIIVTVEFIYKLTVTSQSGRWYVGLCEIQQP